MRQQRAASERAVFVAALTAESTRRGAATWLVGDARQSTIDINNIDNSVWSSEAVSVVRCDQRARRSVNETAMSDERAAQRRVECILHTVGWLVMSAVVVSCCPGRRCRIVKSRSRRGAAQRCRCTCACVLLPTHVNRSSSSCTASLFADDDDDDAGQTAVCSAPCSTPTARRRAASARRRPGVCTPLEHVAAAASSSGVVVRCLLESVAPAVKNAVECAPLHDLARQVQV